MTSQAAGVLAKVRAQLFRLAQDGAGVVEERFSGWGQANASRLPHKQWHAGVFFERLDPGAGRRKRQVLDFRSPVMLDNCEIAWNRRRSSWLKSMIDIRAAFCNPKGLLPNFRIVHRAVPGHDGRPYQNPPREHLP
jgi:hypothetical protein